MPAFGPELSSPRAISPDDDLDLRLEELRGHLDHCTARWGFHENIFYGLVILLLLGNMALLCWLAVTL